ncbi:MAG: ABC transporter permease [Acidimicrobiia bacterium]
MRAAYRVLVRTQLTRGRMITLAIVGLLGLLLALAIRSEDSLDPVSQAYGFADRFGMGLLVPVVSLVFAAASLGDLTEDGTLVYLWLRPVARWRIAAASLAATMTAVVPFGILPTVLAAAVAGGDSDVIVATAAAASLAATAYVALFVGFGLVVQRALAWGLVYLLIWEGFVARGGRGPARLSVLVYARSVLARLADVTPPELAASMGVAVAVPLLIALAAALFTTWRLREATVA